MKKTLYNLKLRFVFFLVSVSIFSLASAQWVRKADALKPRSEMGETILYNSKLYAFVGFSDTLHHAEPTSEVYDPATDTWTYIASMPANTAFTHADAILIDNTVWHIGGRVGQSPGPTSSKIWIYNITTNTWSAGPEIRDPATGQPIVIAASGSALLGRVLHIFGGFSPTACDDDQDKYHLTLDVDTWLANPSSPAQWENKLKPLPLKRNHLSALTLGGKIYAIGGQLGHDCSGGTEVPYCHVYNPSSDTWTALTSLPTGRSHAEGSVFAIDGKIYIAGGQKGDGSSTTMITVFDPAGNNGAGIWTANSFGLPYIYEGLSAAVIGTNFIVSHGSQGTSKYPLKQTYVRTITRNPVYKLGFPSGCLNLNDSTAGSLKGNTWLFTIDGTKSYTTSSNANWLVVSKNATGTAIPTAVDIEITADTTGLAPGVYTGTITATGIAGGISYTAATLCVSLTVKQKYSLQYDLTVSSAGSGSVVVDPDQVTFNSGATVTLTAKPAASQQFTGWSGDASGISNPLLITMNADKVITATFSEASSFTVSNIAPTTGRTYTLGQLIVGTTIYTDRTYIATTVPAYLNNAACIKTANDDKSNSSDELFSFAINQNATIYVAYDPRATALPTWMSGWQKLNGQQVGINDSKINYLELYSKNYTAGTVSLGGNIQNPATGAQNNYFVIIVPQTTPLQYNLTVSTNGEGSVTKNPNLDSYDAGTNVTLTAIPAAGQQFAGWSGAATGTVNPLTIAMDGNKSVTATFATIQYTLTVTLSGSGSVTKNPNQNNYDAGTNITLTAIPAAGQQFAGWSGAATGTVNPLTIAMNGNKSVTATFVPVQYTLTVTLSGNGSVTKNPNQNNYDAGTNVTLTAIPAAGQQFAEWSGAATGTVNPLVVTMDANKSITASFIQAGGLVSNITTTTGRQYILSEITVGVTVYSDRTIQATTVPASLNNAPFIKTSNDDKSNKSATLFSFDINQNATVYVAYDPRGRNLPAWLSGWQKLTGQQIGINDSKINYMQLYSKSYAAGKVSLGGNLQNPSTGSLSNYFVIIQPQQLQQRGVNKVANGYDKNAIDKDVDKIISHRNKTSIAKLTIYPNPNPGDKIRIKADNFGKYEVVVITFRDAMGRIIKSMRVSADEEGAINKNILLTNQVGKGLYIISVVSPSQNVQEKIIIR